MPLNCRMGKRNVVNLHNGEFVVKNDLMKIAYKWMKLEKVILGEITQAQREKYYMYSLNIC